VQETLVDLAEIMGARAAAICRELTKLHEEVTRGTLIDLAAQAETLETRGEFVLVIGPPEADAQTFTDDALDNLLREQLRDHSVKDAVALASELSGRPRREVYARALEVAKEVKGNGED
jgi:16S rRNA (cytidine1402-2'-O)-methyltransferase